MRTQADEVPWFTEPPNAVLRDNHAFGPHLKYLHFYGPDDRRAVIWVTEGDDRQQVYGQNVWHIVVEGTVATVSPSVHFVGYWHSPNPVKFNLVEDL